MTKVLQKSFVRETAFLLLMVAMLVRAFMPAGFMPAFGDTGSMQVVICSGISEKTLTVDSHGSEQSPAPEKKTDICGFSVTIGGIEPLNQSILPLPDFSVKQTAIGPVAYASRPRLSQPNPPRAPPFV